MNCPNCNSLPKKHGKDRYGNQRFRCLACGKTYTANERLEGKNLPVDKIELCINLLVEGNSVRATERIANVHRDTILRLLETVGQRCMWIQENFVKDVKVNFVQADEIWSFVQMKDKTKHSKDIEDEKIGSAYTFTTIDAETKLIVGWHLGHRTEKDTFTFLQKVKAALDQDAQFQISTDAFSGYKRTVPMTLPQAHFGQIRKFYGIPNPNEVRYSGGEVIHTIRKKVNGNPIKKNISTSMVERHNLTMRMSMRRFTRLTNGFSKKWENLNYHLALNFAYYNFVRPHKTLDNATPAMAAGLAKTFWTLKDLIGISNTN